MEKTEKDKIVSDLTTLQWRIHDYLKEQKRLVSLREIYEAFKDFYPPYDSAKGSWNNSYARRIITDDLNAIANSKIVQKVLIRNPNGVGFLDEDQTYAYLRKEACKLSKQLKTLSTLKRKASLNNQKKLVFNSEKDIVEAFMNMVV